MKKQLLPILASLAILLLSCQKEEISLNTLPEASGPAPAGRNCASMDVLAEQLRAHPALKTKMDAIESFTRNFISNPELQRLSGDTMIIPLIVNVLYNTNNIAENIDIQQINSQISVLNDDYSGTNSDITSVPSLFSGVKSGDTKIRFVLNKVVRKGSTKSAWRTNDDMKRSAKGGIDPTNPTRNLNIWVCNLSNKLLGYAQFPGGDTLTDGVVITTQGFGSRLKFPGGYYFSGGYDRGRTATHEVGHWFNLRHIWGDSNCGNDQVGDTPLHNSANYGCPAYPTKSTCTGAPIMMTMNYMDYTDDACMYMFTSGQKSRMSATYASAGPRASFR